MAPFRGHLTPAARDPELSVRWVIPSQRHEACRIQLLPDAWNPVPVFSPCSGAFAFRSAPLELSSHLTCAHGARPWHAEMLRYLRSARCPCPAHAARDCGARLGCSGHATVAGVLRPTFSPRGRGVLGEATPHYHSHHPVVSGGGARGRGPGTCPPSSTPTVDHTQSRDQSLTD